MKYFKSNLPENHHFEMTHIPVLVPVGRKGLFNGKQWRATSIFVYNDDIIKVFSENEDDKTIIEHYTPETVMTFYPRSIIAYRLFSKSVNSYSEKIVTTVNNVLALIKKDQLLEALELANKNKIVRSICVGNLTELCDLARALNFETPHEKDARTRKLWNDFFAGNTKPFIDRDYKDLTLNTKITLNKISI